MIRKDFSRLLGDVALAGVVALVVQIIHLGHLSIDAYTPEDLLNVIAFTYVGILVPILTFHILIVLRDQEQWSLLLTLPVSKRRLFLAKATTGLAVLFIVIGLGAWGIIPHAPVLRIPGLFFNYIVPFVTFFLLVLAAPIDPGKESTTRTILYEVVFLIAPVLLILLFLTMTNVMSAYGILSTAIFFIFSLILAAPLALFNATTTRPYSNIRKIGRISLTILALSLGTWLLFNVDLMMTKMGIGNVRDIRIVKVTENDKIVVTLRLKGTPLFKLLNAHFSSDPNLSFLWSRALYDLREERWEDIHLIPPGWSSTGATDDGACLVLIRFGNFVLFKKQRLKFITLEGKTLSQYISKNGGLYYFNLNYAFRPHSHDVGIKTPGGVLLVNLDSGEKERIAWPCRRDEKNLIGRLFFVDHDHMGYAQSWLDRHSIYLYDLTKRRWQEIFDQKAKNKFIVTDNYPGEGLVRCTLVTKQTVREFSKQEIILRSIDGKVTVERFDEVHGALKPGRLGYAAVQKRTFAVTNWFGEPLCFNTVTNGETVKKVRRERIYTRGRFIFMQLQENGRRRIRIYDLTNCQQVKMIENAWIEKATADLCIIRRKERGGTEFFLLKPPAWREKLLFRVE